MNVTYTSEEEENRRERILGVKDEERKIVREKGEKNQQQKQRQDGRISTVRKAVKKSRVKKKK